jgi:hypothetical protein
VRCPLSVRLVSERTRIARRRSSHLQELNPPSSDPEIDADGCRVFAWVRLEPRACPLSLLPRLNQLPANRPVKEAFQRGAQFLDREKRFSIAQTIAFMLRLGINPAAVIAAVANHPFTSLESVPDNEAVIIPIETLPRTFPLSRENDVATVESRQARNDTLFKDASRNFTTSVPRPHTDSPVLGPRTFSIPSTCSAG